MLVAKHYLPKLKRLLVYLLSLQVLPLAGEHIGEVVHTAEGRGMLAAQHCLYKLECLLLHLLSL